LVQILHSAAYAETPTLDRKLREEMRTQDPGLRALFSMIYISKEFGHRIELRTTCKNTQ
jgi:hypothetical protein